MTSPMTGEGMRSSLNRPPGVSEAPTTSASAQTTATSQAARSHGKVWLASLSTAPSSVSGRIVSFEQLSGLNQ